MMEIIKEISQCSKCPFWGNSMDGMECRHPYWESKAAYENMIITQSNVGSIPKECPLKNESVTTIVRLSANGG
jgi:hypothetical protein